VVASVLAVVTLLIGTPIAFSLVLPPVVGVFTGQTPPSYVPTQLQAGLGGYILLAVPFFVFAGYLMTDGGLGRSIIELLSPLLRRAPGGLLQLAVGTMFIFSGMSGAKIADVAAVGSTLRQPLHDEAYDAAEAAAVLSACASAGETIPPSIAMLILGSITTVSIGTLFVAGIVPALVVGAAISLIIALRDRSHRSRRTPAAPERVSLGRALGGLPALGLPVILIGGIESGVVTPTESGAIAVAYALLVAIARRHPLSPRRLLAIIEESAAMSGMLLLLIAAANALAATFSLAEVPQRLAGWIASLGGSSSILLILTIICLPIAGAFLEGIPAVLVFGPLLVPAAIGVGINGVQFSIVFILAMGIGAFSPLLGIGFFTACRILDAPVATAARRYTVYFATMIAAVCVIAFVPQIALSLPKLFGMPGS
jgi:tripartite ATP-independent transporter DctM subunit